MYDHTLRKGHIDTLEVQEAIFGHHVAQDLDPVTVTTRPNFG